ncbi:MAG: cation transporter [Candidatus Marinimicrobia bacterium]|nr:cation transporter [Candidatus Neomarinimicrobiota bacterium]
MSHSHHHHHPQELDSSTTARMFITMTMNFIITIAEVVGGILSGSLSLISDALHNLTDGFAIIISYIALRLRKVKHSPGHTFGLKRAEIFAAVINSTILLVIAIFLFYEAVHRFISPEPIRGKLMVIVASIGLLANLTGTLLLRKDSHKSINIRSAYLHLLIDTLSSVTVIVGGLLITFFNIVWIDPLLTILIAIYVLKESLEILKESSHILLEGAPLEIDLHSIQQKIENLPEVGDIHHVHIWKIGEKDIHFEAHINCQEMMVSETVRLHQRIEPILKDFGISHVTLQFECNVCENTNLIKEE